MKQHEKTVDELVEDGDDESAIRLCHTRDRVASQVRFLCAFIFGWDDCNDADIFDYGEDTGCRPGAPTARKGFEVRVCVRALRENSVKERRRVALSLNKDWRACVVVFVLSWWCGCLLRRDDRRRRSIGRTRWRFKHTKARFPLLLCTPAKALVFPFEVFLDMPLCTPANCVAGLLV